MNLIARNSVIIVRNSNVKYIQKFTQECKINMQCRVIE